jgi:putative DNA methylase
VKAGEASQIDAASQLLFPRPRIVSTDPPYYDNIGYGDLSDFFYVWLRRSLHELVATPYRHGSRERAKRFFLDGMTQAMRGLAEQAHPAFPVTIYYAFKQTESDGADGSTSTGWDTFLGAATQAGLGISGTWPIRTERTGGFRNKDQNALASSIVLVCRPRDPNAPTATRREFVAALKAELPQALAHLQRSNIAPVDLAQAAIGPGMAVYTRYAKVLDATGKPVPVREALALINQVLDEALAEQEGDFDADTRWAVAWFEQAGFGTGEYGVAETLSKAKNTSVDGMKAAGLVASKAGKVRLLKPDELPADWEPSPAATAWEAVHHLVRVLGAGGEAAAADLAAKLGSKAETARELAYRLYTIAERKKRQAEARAYNELVQSWPEIVRLAREGRRPQGEQASLLPENE